MPDARKYKILVVDDDKDLRELIAIDFENLGYSTSSASDGTEALTFLGKDEFDVVVTDLRMAKLDGLGLFKKMLEMKFKRDPVTIFITGFSDVNAIEAFNLGVADYIEKPFSRRSLINSVQRLLKSEPDRWKSADAGKPAPGQTPTSFTKSLPALRQAIESENLKLGRGGFSLALDKSDSVGPVGGIVAFDVDFGKEAAWKGLGRVRWVVSSPKKMAGIEFYYLEPGSLESVLKCQSKLAELGNKSYIPKP